MRLTAHIDGETGGAGCPAPGAGKRPAGAESYTSAFMLRGAGLPSEVPGRGSLARGARLRGARLLGEDFEHLALVVRGQAAEAARDLELLVDPLAHLRGVVAQLL